jgi:hypothetical protein
MEVYGGECLSHTQIFEWFERFHGERGEIKDDPHPSQPRTSKTDDNFEKVGEIVRKNHCLSIRAIAELANINKEHFNMKKVCSKMVPRILTPEQKETQMEICADSLQTLKKDPDFLGNVITCDELWFFQYDPETQRQSMHWKNPSSPRKRSTEEQVKFQSSDDHFLIFEGLFTLIGCLKVRPLSTSNIRRF